ncbi:MAG: FliH/SctL family protein [Erythrobacter sp.]|nr:FliH/SctL family protein [Erythrobacter sp.]
MANSSEWIEQVDCVQRDEPNWLAALKAQEGFQEASPFAKVPTDGSASSTEVPPPDTGASERSPVDAVARAYAEGETVGREAANAEAQVELDRQRRLRLAFRTLDQAAMDSLAGELSATVIELCEQVLKTSAIDREGLLDRCNRAARRIGSAASQTSLHLHPDDLDLIGQEALADWKVQIDSAMPRGSLALEGPDGSVRDGPAEWRRAIAEAIRG